MVYIGIKIAYILCFCPCLENSTSRILLINSPLKRAEPFHYDGPTSHFMIDSNKLLRKDFEKTVWIDYFFYC